MATSLDTASPSPLHTKQVFPLTLKKTSQFVFVLFLNLTLFSCYNNRMIQTLLTLLLHLLINASGALSVVELTRFSINPKSQIHCRMKEENVWRKIRCYSSEDLTHFLIHSLFCLIIWIMPYK